MISPVEWAAFSETLDAFNIEVGQQQVGWKHITVNLPRYGEGELPTYEQRSISCIVSYNAFRVWPIEKETSAGSLDKEYCHLLLNNNYLNTEGWVNIQNYFEYDPRDIFTVNGKEHEVAGVTPVSQGRADPLYTILVLKRKTTNTSSIPT